jgi:hypothetical protein
MTDARIQRTRLLLALSFALVLVAGSAPRVIGDGGEYLAQALNFASLNRPSFGRQAIPVIERQVSAADPGLAEWGIERASIPGRDRRRDFLHFWFYGLLATPFVWITKLLGLSPLHAFTALNLTMLAIALHLALKRAGNVVAVLLFASPLVWYLDKAHTEVFTVSLLTIALLTMRDRPWWAMTAAGAASTQNPPVTAVLLLIGLAVLIERRADALRDRRIIAGAIGGGVLAVLQPAYTYLRHGTPSLLLNATLPGFPTAAELSASVLDPSMGLIGNFPVFLVATTAALVWLGLRHRRVLLSPEVAVAAVSGLVFLYSFARTSNPHHGGTPSLTRYALWFIPLALAVWVPWHERVGVFGRRFVAAASAVSAFVSVIAFHPGVPQNTREPTWLASWLWTTHPRAFHPLPEVFSETLLRVEGTHVPVATARCEKVLITGRDEGEPVWPVPCLPAPLPAMCRAAGALCYANRNGSTYTFAKAPGRTVALTHLDDSAWPAAAEPHVRQMYLDADWGALADRSSEALTILRSASDVRVAPFGDNTRALFVLFVTGNEPQIHLRPLNPMQARVVDAMSGRELATLTFQGAAGESWILSIPSGDGPHVLMTLESYPGGTTP